MGAENRVFYVDRNSLLHRHTSPPRRRRRNRRQGRPFPEAFSFIVAFVSFVRSRFQRLGSLNCDFDTVCSVARLACSAFCFYFLARVTLDVSGTRGSFHRCFSCFFCNLGLMRDKFMQGRVNSRLSVVMFYKN